jgi:translation initiation factor IF-3
MRRSPKSRRRAIYQGRVPRDGFKDRPRTNEQIRVPYVKVIGPDKRLIGILPTREAVALARRQDLDLVMLVPNEDPPVCGILDFGRWLYEQKSRQRESKKKQHATEVRDMRMKMKIGPGDYDVKMRKMREILAEKDRIRVTLWVRGREIVHADLGMKLMAKIVEDLADVARIEAPPRLQSEGRKSIQMMLVPK